MVGIQQIQPEPTARQLIDDELAQTFKEMNKVGILGALCAFLLVVTCITYILFGGMATLILFLATMVIMVLCISRFAVAMEHINAIKRFESDFKRRFYENQKRD